MELTGTVQDGVVIFDQKLEIPDGTRAVVRLEEAAPQANGTKPGSPEKEPEPPEDVDVEKDVYVPMPFASELVHRARVVVGTRLPACVILPENLDG